MLHFVIWCEKVKGKCRKDKRQTYPIVRRDPSAVRQNLPIMPYIVISILAGGALCPTGDEPGMFIRRVVGNKVHYHMYAWNK